MEFVSSFCFGSEFVSDCARTVLFYPPWHSVSNEVTDTRNVLLQILRDLKYQYRKLSVHTCMFVLEETVSFTNES